MVLVVIYRLRCLDSDPVFYTIVKVSMAVLAVAIIVIPSPEIPAQPEAFFSGILSHI